MNLTLYGGSRRHFNEDTSERHPELFEWMLRDHPGIEVDRVKEAVRGWKAAGGDFFVWCNSELLYDVVRIMVKNGEIDGASVKRVWYDEHGGKYTMPLGRYNYWERLVSDIDNTLIGIQLELIGR